jgi:Amt family ammonium transporter
MFIGAFASIVSNIAVHMRTKSELDDTLDVFPCHGVGGIVGMILTAVFADKVGLIYGETETFINHIYALGIVTAFTMIRSLVLYQAANLIVPMRVSEAEEEMGLDLSQHGESLDSLHGEPVTEPFRLKVVG